MGRFGIRSPTHGSIIQPLAAIRLKLRSNFHPLAKNRRPLVTNRLKLDSKFRFLMPIWQNLALNRLKLTSNFHLLLSIYRHFETIYQNPCLVLAIPLP